MKNKTLFFICFFLRLFFYSAALDFEEFEMDSEVEILEGVKSLDNPLPAPVFLYYYPNPHLDILLFEFENEEQIDEEQNIDDGIWLAEPVPPQVAPPLLDLETFEELEHKDDTLQEDKPGTSDLEKKIDAVKPETKIIAYVDQILEIVYPAHGWVYIGDSASSSALLYQNRKIENSNTVFLFKAMKEGSSDLQFSRFDVLKDDYNEDLIRVEVQEKNNQVEKIIRFPDAFLEQDKTKKIEHYAVEKELPIDIEKKQDNSLVFFDEPVLSAVQKEDIKEHVESLQFLLEAQQALKEGNQEESLNFLQNFFSHSTEKLDEGLFLQGQIYETNGPLKNIKKALDAYLVLTKTYPESERWNEADEKIRYINRMYLQIW